MIVMSDIPIPCKAEIRKYLNKWKTLENYVLQENSLDKLFFKTYPKNDDINDILIKASSLIVLIYFQYFPCPSIY